MYFFMSVFVIRIHFVWIILHLSSECLFLDAVDPDTPSGIALTRGIQFVCTAWCVIGPTISINNHSVLRWTVILCKIWWRWTFRLRNDWIVKFQVSNISSIPYKNLSKAAKPVKCKLFLYIVWHKLKYYSNWYLFVSLWM